jgi:hypothetical protein
MWVLMSRAGSLSLLLALAAQPGCGTKIVDLVVATDGPSSNDVAPTTKCETVTRSDGSQCQLCYGLDGMVVMSSCAPGGPDAITPVDAAPVCKAVPTGDTTCLLCVTAAGMMTMACIKCDPPVKTSDSGEYCRSCAWSDVGGSCLQCFAVDGKPTFDDCEASRAGTSPDAGVTM